MLAEKCKYEFSHQKLENELLEKGTFQKIPYLKMMDFRQFQMSEISILAKFDKLQRQFLSNTACNLGGKFKCG